MYIKDIFSYQVCVILFCTYLTNSKELCDIILKKERKEKGEKTSKERDSVKAMSLFFFPFHFCMTSHDILGFVTTLSLIFEICFVYVTVLLLFDVYYKEEL